MKERTKLEESTPQPQSSPDARSKWAWRRDWILFVTIVAVFAADQFTKFVIKGTLRLGESWPCRRTDTHHPWLEHRHGVRLAPESDDIPDIRVLHRHRLPCIFLPRLRAAESDSSSRHRIAARRRVRQSLRPGGIRRGNRLHRCGLVAHIQHSRLFDMRRHGNACHRAAAL